MPTPALTIESPILGLVSLALAAICVVLAAAVPGVGRWLLRAGVIAACGAIAGVGVRCERPLRIAVMIDVSPSTRGAAFRDERSVLARLTPLLEGRAYSTHFFADGEQPTSAEPACEQTRLPVPPDADAIVLLSDGRFDAPVGLPPVFAVVDPALDRPSDAVVRDVATADNGDIYANVLSPGGRELVASDGGGAGSSVRPPAGPGVVLVPTEGRRATWRVGFSPGDAWPENDALLTAPSLLDAKRIAIGIGVPGFENRAAGDVSVRADFSDASIVVVPAGVDTVATRDPLVSQSVQALMSAVRDYGTALVIVGPPAELSAAMRPVSPLQPGPAGPQSWVILLDASGSMAGMDTSGRTKWSAAIDAAKEALSRLPGEARVSVYAFAADVRTLAADSTPGDAGRALENAAVVRPGGPTGLRGALESISSRDVGGTRVLLISDGDADLGDAGVLAARMNEAHVRLDAVVTGQSADLQRLCTATGGRANAGTPPERWSDVFGRIAFAGARVERFGRIAGKNDIAGMELLTAARWPAHLANDARLLAGEPGAPVAAVWNVGIGRVVAVAGDVVGLPPTQYAGGIAAFANIAKGLERPPADPRFTVTVDSKARTVRVTAHDEKGPMNDSRLTLSRGDASIAFDAVGPGEYVAPLGRRGGPPVARVLLDNRVVARVVVPGRYPAEFDVIGNDRESLAKLATSSGGAVIEAGDNRPLVLPSCTETRSLRPFLIPLAAILLLTAAWRVRSDGRGSRNGMER